jgi:hypothetical protein
MTMNTSPPRDPSVDQFREVLLTAFAGSPFRSGEISRRAGIHRVQGHRICRGQFKRISANVLKVARVLGIFDAAAGRPGRCDASWGRIEEKVRDIWDGTPHGAERLIAALDTVKAHVEPPYADRSFRAF